MVNKDEYIIYCLIFQDSVIFLDVVFVTQ